MICRLGELVDAQKAENSNNLLYIAYTMAASDGVPTVDVVMKHYNLLQQKMYQPEPLLFRL